MNLSYYLCIVLFGLASCTSKITESTDTAKTDKTEIATKVESNDVLQDDMTNAISYIEKYPSGAVKIKGQKIGDLKVGKWVSFYENGLKWSEAEYYKGTKNGKFKDYFENGMLRYKGAYVNDLKQGPWYFYEEDGKINQKVTYHQGEVVKE